MKFRLAGDWAPNKLQVKSLDWNELLILNLEGPVLYDPSIHRQSPKAGPCLSHSSLPTGLNHVIYSLANNHMMDYGEKGLNETLARITQSNDFHCGVGENLLDSRKPLIIKYDGVRLGLISRCEVQFGVASTSTAGVSPIDATIYQSITELKKKCDLVIISFHAAAEMSPWPSPSRQDLCRAFIDAGADIVHGHHSHIPQGWEKYKDRFIFYGLGNFCVDPSIWSTFPNSLWSLTPRLSFQNSKLEVDIITSTINIHGHSMLEVKDAANKQKVIHNDYLQICNEPLLDRCLLEGLWQEVSINLYQTYFGSWLGFIKPQIDVRQSIYSRLRSLGSKAKRHIHNYIAKHQLCSLNDQPNSQNMLWYHLFVCESHSSAISTALGVLSGVIQDHRTNKTFNMFQQLTSTPH